ncbi:predicted protein [Sclerotinia sclerotiorum 1980 UF-70]|uniref:Uncharacterized protein n=1 Tax=Sclerotinia sclerotiorum (strain ATCC 18683 / 1980 / Ss-1) TaxID=665079 RepID=A7F132_SCLS1|nr:predicted protein [Sclerotinia sclerotiorum 1980 UF-70]EDN95424.1 predicted protein [Sclerotinia sclerotiorum 1980 UF-70]
MKAKRTEMVLFFAIEKWLEHNRGKGWEREGAEKKKNGVLEVVPWTFAFCL